MKKYNLKAQLFVLAVFGCLSIVVGACAIYAILFPAYWTERLPIADAAGRTLTITDYRYATNVSYDGLVAFLANDSTCLADYDFPNYTCGDFAVRLHDSAEARGIMCGIVGVAFNASDKNTSDFSLIHDNGSAQGHGFDVFNTTDRGLVYVDATGITKQAKEQGYQPHVMAVYVEQDMPLGEIAIGQAKSLDYTYYEAQQSQFNAYRQNVNDFLSDVKTFDQKADAFNDTYAAYETDRAAFDNEYNNFSDELNVLKQSTDIDLESSFRLDAQRTILLYKLNALDTRLDALTEQSAALNAEKKSLTQMRAALEQNTDGTMIITQWGVVDRIVVCW